MPDVSVPLLPSGSREISVKRTQITVIKSFSSFTSEWKSRARQPKTGWTKEQGFSSFTSEWKSRVKTIIRDHYYVVCQTFQFLYFRVEVERFLSREHRLQSSRVSVPLLPSGSRERDSPRRDGQKNRVSVPLLPSGSREF